MLSQALGKMILPCANSMAANNVIVPLRLQSCVSVFSRPGNRRQTLLRPVECLNLTLFIARQHQRVLGRVEVQTDDIDQFCGGQWVVRDLERSTRCGISRLSRQIGCTVALLTPSLRPSFAPNTA